VFQHFNEYLEGEEEIWLRLTIGLHTVRSDVAAPWWLGVPAQCGAGRDRSCGGLTQCRQAWSWFRSGKSEDHDSVFSSASRQTT
jgi:hypothetical protein